MMTANVLRHLFPRKTLLHRQHLSIKYYFAQKNGCLQKKKKREIRESVNITLDETKSSVDKTTGEAKKEIPQYTKAVNEYQQETIEATKDIADNFLESQKQVINSFQSLWVPYMDNIQNSYWYYWTPQKATENYTRAVSNVT
jgi:hypothetical protein